MLTWAASFDIGKVNFCFHIGQFDSMYVKSLPKVAQSKRYLSDGTMTKAFERVFVDSIKHGTSIVFQNFDLTYDPAKGAPAKGSKASKTAKTAYLDPQVYHNLTALLDSYSEYWDKCSFFIIEQQMSFGKKHNTMALKLGQHCHSYFLFKYGCFKSVVEFPSYHKTQVLGAEKIAKKGRKGITYKAVDKPARKKWAIEKAREILTLRGEEEMLSHLNNSRKKDDLADVLCQLEAWKILTFIDQKSNE